jgi:manganese/zinc/iron transport system permease protein
VGCFTFLRKRALVGDAISHSVLPGICLGFLLSGTKNPIYLVLGALVTGWLSVVALDFITRKTKLKEDTATGIVLSVFFGIGILLLTVIQSSGNAAQAGLNNFLFGKAASLLPEDILVFGIIAVVLIASILIFYKEFTMISFDEAYASTTRIPVRGLELWLTTLTVLAVVVGIQAVGVVLMAAMLITPAAAARFWTHRLPRMLLLSAVFGIISGIAGAYISISAPAMPTGPWMVIVLSTIAILSFFFAPQKGIFFKQLKQERFSQKLKEENLLKKIYHELEKDGVVEERYALPYHQVIEAGKDLKGTTKHTLTRLKKQGYLLANRQSISLTPAGYTKAERVVRLHRLWEVYLTRYLQAASDHVHDDAESIEHLITPELEAQLMKKLDYPETDPHQSKIPYANL